MLTRHRRSIEHHRSQCTAIRLSQLRHELVEFHCHVEVRYRLPVTRLSTQSAVPPEPAAFTNWIVLHRRRILPLHQSPRPHPPRTRPHPPRPPPLPPQPPPEPHPPRPPPIGMRRMSGIPPPHPSRRPLRVRARRPALLSTIITTKKMMRGRSGPMPTPRGAGIGARMGSA